MSNGSMGNIYEKLEVASYLTEDKEISDLLYDLSEVLHYEEWYRYQYEGYRERYLTTLCRFKRKWFKDNRAERIQDYVDEKIKQLKEELYNLIDVKYNLRNSKGE